MSTIVSAPVSPRSALPASTARPPRTHPRPRAYTPWRAPMSERQQNACFEQTILPELGVLLEAAFVSFSEFDCEEAVQDATCQALVAFRTLSLHRNTRTAAARSEIALALATFTSSRYLSGVRFANARPASRL